MNISELCIRRPVMTVLLSCAIVLAGIFAYGKIPGMVGWTYYGLCFNLPGGIDYFCGAEVSSAAGLPTGFSHCEIPAQRYAVFDHRGHVSELYNTLDAIQRIWAPDHELVRPSGSAPDFFESYGERYDPQKGMGDIEVWIPIIK